MKKRKFDRNNYEKHLNKLLKDKDFKAGFLMEKSLAKFAFELSKERQNRHLTQGQLAENIGMKQQVISRVEQGSQNTTLETLYRIAGGLGKKLTLKLR